MTRALRAAAVTLAAAAIIPTTAASASSGASVGRTLDRAGTLTERAVRLAENGSDARAIKTIRLARRTVTLASRDARRMAAKARTTQRRLDAAGALSVVAARLGEDVEAYAGALDSTDGRVQKTLAGTLPGTIASHDLLVDTLEGLVAKLPVEHQATVEQVIAALVASWPEQLKVLANAANVSELPTQITNLVQTALTTATTALREALGTMVNVVATLPEPAQAAIGSVLEVVQPLLNSVLGIVDTVSQTVTSHISSIMGMVTDLVGGLTGGSTDGGTDGASTGGLGSLFDSIPVVGDLLGGLFGGLPIIGNLFGSR
ncbi:MAG TPA: hypothetical protein VD931_05150 [Baekduia sp.]|nr:hypothetical protein [Baekduia sp.]